MKYLTPIFLLFLTLSLQAEDIYVSQSGAGTQSGTSAANAHSLAWLNTSGNWTTGADRVSPGDTVRLVGTFTSNLTIQGSGTVGNVITILFEPGAKFSKPVWTVPEGGAIRVSSKNYITIDGGATGIIGGPTGNPALVNGIIECTANGTVLANHVNAKGVYASASSNFTVKNLAIINLYVRTSTSDVFYAGGSAVQNNCDQPPYVTNNWTVDNCFIHDCATGIELDFAGTLGGPWTFTRNTIYNVNFGIGGGNRERGEGSVVPIANTVSNITIAYNRMYNWSTWDDPAGNHWHHNGVYIWAEGGGSSVHGVYMYGNVLGPNYGNDFSTTGLWINQSSFGNYASTLAPPGLFNFYAFKNVFLFNANDYSSNGTIQAPEGNSSVCVYNTFVGGGGAIRAMNIGGSNPTVKGNIVQNTLTVWETDSISGLLMDYNIIYQIVSATPYKLAASGFKTFAQMQALGYETNSLQTNPQINSSGVPQTGSPAIAFGPNLTSLGIAQLNTDINGNARPASGKWTAGAYELAAVGPSSPTVISSTINPASTQFAMTFNENIAIGGGGNGGISLSSATGGAITLGAPTISGATITWPITNRLIGSAETITRSYVQPGNGIESSSTLVDATSFSNVTVTNSSTVAQVATPVFSPLPGAYSSTQNVAISITPSPPGAVIRYTTDGTDPTALSTQYTAPIPTSLSTTYKARAFATNYIDSPVATGAYQIGDFVINDTWTNIAVAAQTGVFTWTFRATPSGSANNNVIALADHVATGYADLAVIARFNPSGAIDAFNGLTGLYTAVNSFPYLAGQAYDFVVSVNVPAHTYSMTVVQAGGSTPTTIATNYGFRGASVSAVDLDVFAGLSAAGTATVSNMVFTSAATISRTGMSVNPAGNQITVNFNSQPSFGTGGQGGFTVSASAGAVTASAPTIGTNAITWTLSRTIGRGEAVSATYVQPGNGIEAAAGGADLASFAGQTVVNNSTVDLTPPTPNPSTFGIAPTATSSSTITMTATTSTDAFSGPVSYFFNETSGNAGGSDSSWQSSPTFTDTGLAAGTQYTYRVQVRDSATPPNVTTFSSSASATTRSVAGAHPAQPFNMARANIVTP